MCIDVLTPEVATVTAEEQVFADNALVGIAVVPAAKNVDGPLVVISPWGPRVAANICDLHAPLQS